MICFISADHPDVARPLALTELQGELDMQTAPLTKPLDLDTLNAVNTMLRAE